MSDTKRFDISVTLDGKNVVIKSLAGNLAVLNAALTDILIRDLLTARAAMQPHCDISSPVPGQWLEFVIGVNLFVTRVDKDTIAAMVSHPGLGWLSTNVSPAEWNRLTALVMEIPSGPSRPN